MLVYQRVYPDHSPCLPLTYLFNVEQKRMTGPNGDPPRDCNTSNTEVHELGLQSNFPAGGREREQP